MPGVRVLASDEGEADETRTSEGQGGMKTIRAADLFCGAGGTSTGVARACQRLGLRLNLLAVNHWAIAVETHSANHPKAQHLCETLDSIDPRKAIKGRLDLLLASPECTHHSIARGGRPACDQSRASAWHVVRWAEALRPERILVENVREFATWGPLNDRFRPLKRRRGETYQAWLAALRSLGYCVESRMLRSADYGDPTTRERLFVMAVRGKGPVPWPEPTHARASGPDLFGDRQPWRAAREIIDWSIQGRSIFGRRRPLSDNTLRRIDAGLRRFGGRAAEPFLVLLRRNMTARSVDEPVPTLTANGEHVGLAQPFLIQAGGPTGKARQPRSVDEPMRTVIAENHTGLVEPFIIHTTHHGDRRGHELREPLPTVTGGRRGEMALIQPFIVPFRGERDGQEPRAHSVDSPMPTVTTINGAGLCEPFLVPYYGTGVADRVSDPLSTITTKDRLGLVQPDGAHLDIRFRMLQPHELAAAMGFPADYRFSGNREQVVRQIGNAVTVNLAESLCAALLAA
jgi:DNA (cytosine-5)-methyltransferase 1